MLLALIAALAAGAASPGVGVTERASSEDCAVIAEVGRHLGWTKTGSTEPISVKIRGDDGSIYSEDCDWRNLGIMPTVSKPGTPNLIRIFRPDYAPDHLSAVVVYESVVGADVPSRAAVALARLHLVKMGKKWRLAS
jgi:hypothetical protein